jgi:hypothetical protein
MEEMALVFQCPDYAKRSTGPGTGTGTGRGAVQMRRCL